MVDTLQSIVGNKGKPPPTDMQQQTATLSQDYRRENMESFFDNTAANKQKFGHRFQWDTYVATISVSWVTVMELTVPSIIDFLAIWRTTGTDADDVDMQLLINGTSVQLIDPAWTATADDTEGYMLIGDFLWDSAALGPHSKSAMILDAIQVESLQLQLKRASADFVDNFEMCWRSYSI